ncbi:type II toxin-antitoxin system death-on-curing family toxin [Candidatus Roizmanbacteria bacterium CG_4_9_14_0_2_um_filter_39_13]|uniref:Type II toxin-antitoxin system death-on-curing family toxin n=2 Tax=Candidatus Roizmaniibacteriota TaxID=1752723 RepID=A0A2M8EYL5_9BACT|nr:MAG: type II toxin-antitoxin system death-on-curing family toxin [Candidatus Roizmanbacteria bacterium CG_4_9_14_0_2_um_filter_39_13]PJE61302.1 MAG: type II toxin-antitoxin system death-on-curing family toxin [Candidatus Roizmanbacteria bacterium CG10_big_fil_rev_8_21_14_0_10_39_12]
MRYIDIEEVYIIHERMLQIGGGREGMRDFTLLHSAVERPKATFGGNYLYGSIWTKAAALLHSLVNNHAFNDTNKRTGFFSTIRFLDLNGYQCIATNREVVVFTLTIDNEHESLEEIASWLKRHSKKIL